MGRTFLTPFLLSLLFAAGGAPAARPAALEGRHLFVQMDEGTGRVFLATGNEPREDLLFRDRPPSSFTVLLIGGEPVELGGEGGRFTARPATARDRIRAEWESGGVTAVQTLSLAARKGSGTRDGLLVTLTLENRTGAPLQVGARMIFDTVLGEKAEAHFRLSDGREVRAETVLQGDLPVAWISADPGGRACLRGVLRGELVTAPARVVFANYRRLSSPRGYEPSPGRSFHDPPFSRNDSAVALCFGPDSLPPGGRVSYRTILGLCGGGDYGDTGREVSGMKETGGTGAPAAPGAGPEPGSAGEEETRADAAGTAAGLDPAQAGRVRRELERLARVAASVEEINRLLEEINRLLAGEDAEISPEQVERLSERLDQAR
jgi:hypothetical protein